MASIEYIAGARLRHIDGSEATVNKTATTDDYVVSVENDGGNVELWPRDEIAGFGVLRTDDIPFLVQRVLHTGDQTTIDAGVVYAIDVEQARNQAAQNGMIGEGQSFKVLSLKTWTDGVVPEHFAKHDTASVVGKYSRLTGELAELNSHLQNTRVASTPDQVGPMSPALADFLAEQRRIVRRELDKLRPAFEQEIEDADK